MISLTNIIVSLFLIAGVLGLVPLLGRSRRKAFEKAKAEQLREENRPFQVWICRNCGFMSLMSNTVCTWCSAPRPEEFIYRTIPQKDLAAQRQKPLSKV